MTILNWKIVKENDSDIYRLIIKHAIFVIRYNILTKLTVKIH